MSEHSDTEESATRPLKTRLAALFLKITLPVAVIGGAVMAARLLMDTAPTAERTERVRQARLVEVVRAEAVSDNIRIRGEGSVVPAMDIRLTPQVSGEIVEISDELIPGGRFQRGEMMLRIDSRDYQYVVRQRESEVTRAKALLTLEEGNQDVAKREFEEFEQEISEEDKVLVFRQPQLETAKGELAAARAMLEEAELGLERTVLRAPFDALITTESVDMGSRLTLQTEIARLVGTERYWVEMKVKHDDLKWITLPSETQEGSRVVLRHDKVWKDKVREGRVLRLLPELDGRIRSARLLVAVEDPFSLRPENVNKPRLLIGQYILAEVIGRHVDGVIRIASEHLRDGNFLWVMNASDQLEIRELEILHKGLNSVLVSGGVEEGERIVTTDMATVVGGMPLRISDARPGSVSTDEGPMNGRAKL